MIIKKKFADYKVCYSLIVLSWMLISNNTAIAQWSEWVAPEETKANKSIL